MGEIQYRVNFFVQLFEALVALGTGLVALSLVFTYTDTLAGWSQAELLTVMGVHILMGGIISTMIQPNMMRLMTDVQEGTLDYLLTKPEDSQLLVSVREFRFWQLVDVVVGAVVLGWALQQLGTQIGLAEAAAFLVPVAFAITVPASALTNRLTPQVSLGAAALTLVALLLSRLLWRAGLRRYSGASA